MDDKSQSLRSLLAPLAFFLKDVSVTELRIRPLKVITQHLDERRTHNAPDITPDYMRSLGTAAVTYACLAPAPINYVTLPGGERCTIVTAPAVDEECSVIVIRKALPSVKSLSLLKEEGAFAATRDVSFNKPDEEEAADRLVRSDFGRLDLHEIDLLALKRKHQLFEFLQLAVALKKNIVIAGKTGSGKTTLMRSLCAEIPEHEHIATIEDVHEIFLPHHEEVTHLYYGAGVGRINAQECLAACMRISPDRIMLAELRGAEAWEYTNSLNTDHGGGITTTHANGAIETFNRIASLIKDSETGRTLEWADILRRLYTTIDIVLFIEARQVTQVFYDPVFRRKSFTQT